MRRYHPNRIVDYDASGPRTSPLLKDGVSVHAVSETGHEASFRLLVIGRKQEGEKVETVYTFCERLAKVLTRCIPTPPPAYSNSMRISATHFGCLLILSRQRRRFERDI
jgi:hypothetical protein